MPDTSNKKRNSHKLVVGMTDDERYELLKDRRLNVANYDAARLSEISKDDYSALGQLEGRAAYKVLRKIGVDFGVFRDGYTTQDAAFEFAFSRENLRESVFKQRCRFQHYAKMMTVFDEVIGNAVGIEAHNERYDNPGSRIESMFVFVSAFGSETGILPVLLEVKTYTDETKSSLYIAVSLREIERSWIVEHIPDTESVKSYSLPAPITVMLTDLVAKVNVADKNMLKYLPDRFLGDEQKAAKQAALKETAEYIAKKEAQWAKKSTKPK